MDTNDEKAYLHIRNGGSGFFEQLNGLIAVSGKEAAQFLDGLITNDMKTLEDRQQMLAAFPNAQGRLLATVRVVREGEGFLIETGWENKDSLYQNLERFTFAGDFFVEDQSYQFCQTTIWNSNSFPFADYVKPNGTTLGSVGYRGANWKSLPSVGGGEVDLWIPATQIQEDFLGDFRDHFDLVRVPDSLYETLRIESGIPRFGVDMDETTIVPELGIEEMISYKKGCYIGQEIIARIHFRGHVAKQLTGLTLSAEVEQNSELFTNEGKNAGRITSVTYSPKLKSFIALAFVRYDFLSEGTELTTATEAAVVAVVTKLPFI